MVSYPIVYYIGPNSPSPIITFVEILSQSYSSSPYHGTFMEKALAAFAQLAKETYEVS